MLLRTKMGLRLCVRLGRLCGCVPLKLALILKRTFRGSESDNNIHFHGQTSSSKAATIPYKSNTESTPPQRWRESQTYSAKARQRQARQGGRVQAWVGTGNELSARGFCQPALPESALQAGAEPLANSVRMELWRRFCYVRREGVTR